MSWPPKLIELVAKGTLGIFVGNGLSRISGANSWAELFETAEVREALKKKGIPDGLPYLEIADFLEANAGTLWEGVKRNLADWAKTAKRNNVHQALLEVIKPERRGYSKVCFLTSNVDRLLQDGYYDESDIEYLHGNPNDYKTWVFSSTAYWKAWYETESIQQQFANLNADGILFIGYSHSHEDFDIIQSSLELRNREFGQMFTLISADDAKRGELIARLDRQGISPVEYRVPRDPNLQERELFLTTALLDLAKCAGLDLRDDRRAPYERLKTWCDREHRALMKSRSEAAIVLGLAGTNRHALLEDSIPSGGRRVSVKAQMLTESGGPGYIVASVGRSTGMNSFLATKLASDPRGQDVRADIINAKVSTLGRIYTDFVEVAPADRSTDGFQTWDSFILEPGNDSHRVFVDRKVDRTKMKLSDVTAIAKMIRPSTNPEGNDVATNPPRRVLYFDKYFNDSIYQILQTRDRDRGSALRLSPSHTTRRAGPHRAVQIFRSECLPDC